MAANNNVNNNYYYETPGAVSGLVEKVFSCTYRNRRGTRRIRNVENVVHCTRSLSISQSSMPNNNLSGSWGPENLNGGHPVSNETIIILLLDPVISDAVTFWVDGSEEYHYSMYSVIIIRNGHLHRMFLPPASPVILCRHHELHECLGRTN
jgi:hypothetical protein